MLESDQHLGGIPQPVTGTMTGQGGGIDLDLVDLGPGLGVGGQEEGQTAG